MSWGLCVIGVASIVFHAVGLCFRWVDKRFGIPGTSSPYLSVPNSHSNSLGRSRSSCSRENAELSDVWVSPYGQTFHSSGDCKGLEHAQKPFVSKTLPVLLPQRVIGEWCYSEARLAQITARAVGRQNGVSWLSLFVCAMGIKQRRLVKCLQCQEEYTYFKLFRSYREELQEWIEIAFKGDQGPALLCADCEVKERLKEIERWTKKGRSMKAFPEKYAEKSTVLHDIKQASKGDTWYNFTIQLGGDSQ